MEVHHHSHSSPAHGGASRKKWAHYFWEFIMLFLAVFCGFLAEYQLEHKIEKDREKQFIRSMIEDLETDTANLRISIESFAEQDKYFDTIFNLFPQLAKGYNHLLRTSMINVMGWKTFVATDKTIQQLKYSGGMRLINKRKIADAIAGYDALLRADMLDMPQLDRALDKVNDRLGEILDLQGLETALQTASLSELEKGNKNYLLKDDAGTLGQYYNSLKVYRILRVYTVERMTNIKSRVSALIVILKDGYNIK